MARAASALESYTANPYPSFRFTVQWPNLWKRSSRYFCCTSRESHPICNDILFLASRRFGKLKPGLAMIPKDQIRRRGEAVREGARA
uniref:Uncharacterized protein n=1 Tax=Arundo donax TaxID=35708 RepID=A0A0A9GP50_ARUDO